MKRKVFSIILAIGIISTSIFSLMSINTSAEVKNENLCKFFDSTVGVATSGFFGTDAESFEAYEGMPIGSLFYSYTLKTIKDKGELAQYTKVIPHEFLGTVTTYTIPYNDFVKYVSDFTDFTFDFTKDTYFYRPETNDIYFGNEIYFDGVDLGHPAYVIGYTPKADNRYSVYVQRMQLGYSSIEELEDNVLKPGGDFYDDIAGKPYYEDYDREKDTFLDYYGSYHLVHRNIFYKVDITYNDNKIVYHSVTCKESIDDDKPAITKDSCVGGCNGCTVVADKNVFPSGTIIDMRNINDGKIFEMVKTSLDKKATAFKLYDIFATQNSQNVQPNGKVKVTFEIPNEYNKDRVAVFYISPDGKAENLGGTVDKENKTISVDLTHFSTYAVAELATEQTENGKSLLSPKTGDNSRVELYVFVMILSFIGIITTSILNTKQSCK